MQKQLSGVQDFHETFGIKVNMQPQAILGLQEIMLRYDLMKEENDEYLQAALDGDMIEIADALGDMLYILCGTILTHGLQHKIEAIFEEIQRSNMSKLSEEGKPIYREDGKILKGPNFSNPDFSVIFAK